MTPPWGGTPYPALNFDRDPFVRYKAAMKLVARLLVLLTPLWVEGVWAVDCASSNYRLASQLDVDFFGAMECDTILGRLNIGASSGITNISNLDGLANLTSVGADLLIYYNHSLTNLDGLANLTSVGGYLEIIRNNSLVNCEGVAPVLGWPDGPPDDNVSGGIDIFSNGIGCNSVEEILALVPLRPPIAPVITSTDYEDGKIILRVSVSDNGGTGIREYEAICTDGTNTYAGTSTSSPITVSGLTNDVAYTCTVTATNSVGTSLASAATDPITPEATATGLPIWLLYQATQ